jgi:hypothetical protein
MRADHQALIWPIPEVAFVLLTPSHDHTTQQ